MSDLHDEMQFGTSNECRGTEPSISPPAPCKTSAQLRFQAPIAERPSPPIAPTTPLKGELSSANPVSDSSEPRSPDRQNVPQYSWHTVSSSLRGHDEELIKRWNEQIASFLVFAGLFSAVVTAFNVDSYQRLQPDPNVITQNILTKISGQLSDITFAIAHGAVTNTTAAPTCDATQFAPSNSSIIVNTLWYASLVCSLIAASLGILVQQWLQRFTKEDYSALREGIRVRQHRYNGLLRWRVPEIVGFLPLLLRISLTLFLAGMIIFLTTLNSVVAWFVGVLIIFWLIGYVASSILPTVHADCPYKSPEAAVVFQLISLAKQGGEKWSYVSWDDQEVDPKVDSDLDVDILSSMDSIFADRHLGTTVRECTKDLDPNSAVSLVNAIFCRRFRIKTTRLICWDDLGSYVSQIPQIPTKTIDALTQILMDVLEHGIDEQLSISGRVSASFWQTLWAKYAITCITALLQICKAHMGQPRPYHRGLVKILATMLRSNDVRVENLALESMCLHPILCQEPLAFALPKLCDSALTSIQYRSLNTLPQLPVLHAVIALACERDSTQDPGLDRILRLIFAYFEYNFRNWDGSSNLAVALPLIRSLSDSAASLAQKEPDLCTDLSDALQDLRDRMIKNMDEKSSQGVLDRPRRKDRRKILASI